MQLREAARKRQCTLDELKPALVSHCLALYDDKLSAIFVIGSYATGYQRDESDLDLLIVIDESGETRPRRVRSFDNPPGYDGPELSPVIYTRAEFLTFPSFVLTLLDGYEVVYSRTHDAVDDADALVIAVREFVTDHGIKRVRHKGGYYWSGLPT